MLCRNVTYNIQWKVKSQQRNTLIKSIIIARLVKSAVVCFASVYPNDVREFVDEIRLDNILGLDAIVLIVLEPCRRIVVVLIPIIF